MTLAAAWAEHDRQCLLRGTRRNDAYFPTVDATGELAAEVSALADRLGVVSAELHAWMQALRRAGHDVDGCCSALEALAAALDRAAI
jgi:hypothetical protein